MSGEPQYSLSEAQRELTRRECVINGHDWDVRVLMGDRPTLVICLRCGIKYRVETESQSD